MPWTGFEIAQRLVFHLIELDIELHKLIILVPVKDGYVVTRTKSQRTPDQRYSSLRQQVAGILHVREVIQLECNMMHSNNIAPQKIHGMVIRTAPHEYEKVPIQSDTRKSSTRW